MGAAQTVSTALIVSTALTAVPAASVVPAWNYGPGSDEDRIKWQNIHPSYCTMSRRDRLMYSNINRNLELFLNVDWKTPSADDCMYINHMFTCIVAILRHKGYSEDALGVFTNADDVLTKARLILGNPKVQRKLGLTDEKIINLINSIFHMPVGNYQFDGDLTEYLWRLDMFIVYCFIPK